MANERRLIDANALLVEVVKAQALEPNTAVAKIIMLLTEAERVDAVEVVRCKDCKHNEHYDALLYCGHTRGLAGSVAPDSFCSYGERKDNG